MACANCNKNKNKKQDLLYIMNPNCGWCKKSDPVVDELRKSGYEITTLDITNPQDAERANEAKTKHGAQCGTPLFLDNTSGNIACGFKEKDVLEKWANGEEIPKPAPRPQPNNQQPPNQQPQQPSGPQRHKLEYVWLDGNDSKTLRSKIRYATITSSPNILSSIPEWSFDGSSTNQATTEQSDLLLKPVKVFPNAMESRQGPALYILCEVYNIDGTPHKSNTRNRLKKNMEVAKDSDLWAAVEQEFVAVDPTTGKPLGWDKYDNETPPPQGKYYCGVGANNTKARQLMDGFMSLCPQSGIQLEGYHPEVMLSQWEYQTSAGSPLDIADQLWMSRFILQRMAERMDIAISYDPKPVDGDWNGSGAHINFSTRYMREESDMDYMNLLCANMQDSHKKAIKSYGHGNEKRLTGKHETSSIKKFTWGEGDRSASVRIPLSTIRGGGLGYLEDRRPSANMDPYEAFSYLVPAISHINEDLLVTT